MSLCLFIDPLQTFDPILQVRHRVGPLTFNWESFNVTLE